MRRVKEQKDKVAEVKTQMEVIPAGSVLAHAQDETRPAAYRSMTRRSRNSNSNIRQSLAISRLSSKLTHSLAVLGMYVALFVLCGFYIYHRDPRIVDDLSRLATLLSVGRSHGHADRHHEQRLAGRNGSTHAVWHDRRHCV